MNFSSTQEQGIETSEGMNFVANCSLEMCGKKKKCCKKYKKKAVHCKKCPKL
jgi:hypothetical protein